MKKTVIVALLLLLSMVRLSAQSNPVALGGEATGSGGTASFTTGEVFYTFKTDASDSSTDGVQQGLNNSYTITFDANEGTGTMAAQTLESSTAANLTANAFTRTGYTFAGWATTNNGAVAYANSASYTMGDSDVTLYAQWIKVPTISAVGSLTFCAGGNVELKSSSPSGNEWYKDDILIPNAVNETYTATETGVYTVKVRLAGVVSVASAASAGTNVTVNALPIAGINNTTETTVLTCKTTAISVTAKGGTRYAWDNGLGNTALAIITTPGTFTVTVTNANGCTSKESITITKNVVLPTTPIISTTTPTTFCPGGNVTLTSTPSTSYLWSNGATTRSITVDSSALYTVVVNNGTCNSLPSVARKVTVNPVPKTPIITTSGPTSICSGKTVTLTSSSATGNVWSTGANTQSITVGLAGTYTVTATSLGCTSPRSEGVTVTINALPITPTITASGATTFCAGGTVTLTSTGTNNVWSTGSTEKSIVVNSAGNYTVISSNGCESLTSLPRVVVVNPIPASPTISVIGSTNLSMGGSVTLTSSYATANKWSTGATVRTITVTTPGTYSVSFVGSTCSSKPSLPVTITQNTIENSARFSNSTENETTIISSKMSIYPNPTKGIFNIETDTAGDVYIVNQLGQVVKAVKVEANVVNTINAENLAKGIYLVKQSNKSQASKLIIQD